LDMLLLEPQPQKTNEMIARQKRLETAFNVDIVRRELRPARRGNVASPDADLGFLSRYCCSTKARRNVQGKNFATEPRA
jgi:hypothetical protein